MKKFCVVSLSLVFSGCVQAMESINFERTSTEAIIVCEEHAKIERHRSLCACGLYNFFVKSINNRAWTVVLCKDGCVDVRVFSCEKREWQNPFCDTVEVPSEMGSVNDIGKMDFQDRFFTRTGNLIKVWRVGAYGICKMMDCVSIKND